MSHNLLLRLLLLLLLLSSTSARGKKVSGDFRLSGVDSEHVLTSFAVSPEYGARFTLTLSGKNMMYPTKGNLKLHLFSDEEWGRHLKVMTCHEKIQHAMLSRDIAFQYVDDQWQLKDSPLMDHILTQAQKDKVDAQREVNRQKSLARQHQEELPDMENIFETKEERDLLSKTQAFTATRPQYWYITIDDCMLEQTNLDDKVPMMHYELEIVNSLEPIKDGNAMLRATHLSADEMKSTQMHIVTLIISGGIAFFLVITSLRTTKGRASTIHAAVLWVALAAALDAMSSFCEICHLTAYERNGYGSYFLDAMSAHLEALCDSLLMLLLLSIGAGWTLPSDAVLYRDSMNENAIQQAFTDLASPLRSIMQFNLVGMICGGTIAFQALLCQWGRTYDDDFESYHDLEHFPGKILMLLRIGLGFVCLAVSMRTSLQAKVTQLQSFYKRLALLGFLWFQSMPFVTWMCNLLVPYYLRHPAVVMWSALLQSSMIVLLAWLVASHSQTSAFAQYSHITSGGGSSYGESMDLASAGVGGSTRFFKFGKTKIAID